MDIPEMLCPIYSTTAASPLLFLGLQKIARTITPRLAVGYRIVSRTDCHCTTPAERPLGDLLYLDRLLAGGIVGEVLPLTTIRPNCIQACHGGPLMNQQLDADRDCVGHILDVFL